MQKGHVKEHMRRLINDNSSAAGASWATASIFRSLHQIGVRPRRHL
jgi:hypothetical protein